MLFKGRLYNLEKAQNLEYRIKGEGLCRVKDYVLAVWSVNPGRRTEDLGKSQS